MKSRSRLVLCSVALWCTASVAYAQFPLPPGLPQPGGQKPGGQQPGGLPPNPLQPPQAESTAGAPSGLPGPFDQLLGALGPVQGKQIGEQLNEAIRGVSLYPERTRTAILTLTKYAHRDPKLVADLAALRGKPAAEIDKGLTTRGYATELQNAAAIVLLDAPGTLDKMQAHPELVAAMGAAYDNPAAKALVDAVLTAAHEKETQTQSAAADRWAEQLQANPALLKQYLQMLADYTAQAQASNTTATGTESSGTGTTGETTGTESTGTVSGSASYDPYGYGTTASADGYSVSDVPSEEVVNYALAYGYQYGEVANAMINQYVTQDNLDDYQQAVGNWWDNYGSQVSAEDYAKNSDYYDSLKELSQFDQEAAASVGGEATTAAQRSQFLEQNAGKYGQLTKRVGQNPGRNPAQQPGAAGRNLAGQGPLGSQGPLGGKGPFGGKGPLGQQPGGQQPGGQKPPFAQGPGGTQPGGSGPFSQLGQKPPMGAAGSPFSSLQKGMPQSQKLPNSPQLQGGPFAALQGGKAPVGGKGGNPFGQLAGGKQPPMNVMRSQPAFGNQLARAQSFQGAAWRGPQGGGPKAGGMKPGGMRPGGGMPGGGMRPGGGAKPGGGPGGGPRPGPR